MSTATDYSPPTQSTILLAVTVKIKFTIQRIGKLQQPSWYEASVTTGKASTPVATNAKAAILESISLALLLSNSDNVGLDSGDRGLAVAVQGRLSVIRQKQYCRSLLIQ